ncbi:MAG: type 2 isopentenyl-diphosphate Delta-isomerase [Methanomassiliicoccales archaeon]
MPESGSRSTTQRRKGEHVDIVVNREVGASVNYWDDVFLVHSSLPEVDFDEIRTETTLLGRKISAPILISGMTGGYDKARKINENLAFAASELQIPMGVGSQRAALEDRGMVKTYSVVAEYDIPLRIANIGAPQLIQQRGKRAYGVEEARQAMEMINADIIAIHLNYLQEVVQPEGDRRAKGVLSAIADICRQLPVLAKETGAGISRTTALKLKKAGVKAIDVGGSGGTSWSAVEHYRAVQHNDSVGARLGNLYWNWGIPTPVSLILSSVGLPLVATGGIRHGLDMARALILGASAAGIAGAVIRQAVKGKKEVLSEIQAMLQELKAAMFLSSCADIASLSTAEYMLSGRTRKWVEAFEPQRRQRFQANQFN